MNIGYIRVSSRDQNTARQLDGIELDQVFEDKISGVIKDRPQLSICLQVLRKGDTLHVHSLDRLARSLRHLQEIVEDLTSRGVTIHFHNENLIFSGDNDNPVSMLMLQILGAIAQFERKISKSRQREGIAQAKVNGTKSGKPFGKTPLDQSLRPKAIELCDQGLNITEIAKSIKVSRASVYKLLQGHTRNIHY